MSTKLNNNMSIDYLKLGFRFSNIDKFYESSRTHDEAVIMAFQYIVSSLFSDCSLKYSSEQRVKSYSNVMTVVNRDAVVVALLAAPTDLEHILIQVSGGQSDLCKSIIRHDIFMKPSTWVMRVDIAYDIFESDLSYDDASKYIAEFCDNNKLAQSEQSSYTQAGQLKRTQYGGARSGYSMCRFYEKSVQINDTSREKWNRFEFEIKPTKEKRNKRHRYDIKSDILALIDNQSLKVFCYSKLGVYMSEFINKTELEQLTRTEKHYSDAVNSVSYMLVQYFKKIEEVKSTHDVTLDQMLSCVVSCKELGYTDTATIESLSEFIQSKSKNATNVEVPLSLIGGTPPEPNIHSEPNLGDRDCDFKDIPF